MESPPPILETVMKFRIEQNKQRDYEKFILECDTDELIGAYAKRYDGKIFVSLSKSLSPEDLKDYAVFIQKALGLSTVDLIYYACGCVLPKEDATPICNIHQERQL